MYPRVVIPSLAKRLEKLPFCHSYTSFGVWPSDHYMPLQRFTMGPWQAWMSNYANSSTMTPLAPYESRWVITPICHSSEQGTLPTASLISKQVVPYQTCGDTSCPVVSTPMTRSLADSSMINHITWRIPTVSTIPNLAQTTASNLTTVTSHHDRWKTSTLNTPQVKLNIIKMERIAWHSRLHS
jgi:hypothetical protein